MANIYLSEEIKCFIEEIKFLIQNGQLYSFKILEGVNVDINQIIIAPGYVFIAEGFGVVINSSLNSFIFNNINNLNEEEGVIILGHEFVECFDDI